jgi:hypothetical protein
MQKQKDDIKNCGQRFNWFRTESSGGLMWTRWWNCGFYKIWSNFIIWQIIGLFSMKSRWWWRHNARLKRRSISSKLNSATSHKIATILLSPFQHVSPENEDGKLLLNVDSYVQAHTKLQPRSPALTSLLPWEAQISQESFLIILSNVSKKTMRRVG